METKNEIKKIALSDLRSCYHQAGIFASKTNFSDYWARDTFWTSIGLLESHTTGQTNKSFQVGKNDLSQVKKSLELFIKSQRLDGKIPRKIILDFNWIKYLFKIKILRKKPFPVYNSAIGSLVSFDDNLLFIIAFCKYFEKTKDLAFTKKHFDKIVRALEFYGNKNLVRNDLLFEKGLANWQDAIFKKGFVFYTNCLWFEAIRSFENLSKGASLGHQQSATEKNLPSSSRVKAQIQKLFWINPLSKHQASAKIEGFFADSVSLSGKKETYFDLAGNLMATIFGIAAPDQAELIFKKIDAIEGKLNHPLLHPINYPRYPFWRISPANHLLRIHRYQNGISWSWIESLLAIAYLRNGWPQKAKTVLGNLSEITINNKHLHETYYLDGRPFSHFIWKSASPFAWGASLLFWAVSEYEKRGKK